MLSLWKAGATNCLKRAVFSDTGKPRPVRGRCSGYYTGHGGGRQEGGGPRLCCRLCCEARAAAAAGGGGGERPAGARIVCGADRGALAQSREAWAFRLLFPPTRGSRAQSPLPLSAWHAEGRGRGWEEGEGERGKLAAAASRRARPGSSLLHPVQSPFRMQ